MAKLFCDAKASCKVGNGNNLNCSTGKNIGLGKELGLSYKYETDKRDIIYRSNKKPVWDVEECCLIMPKEHEAKSVKEIVAQVEYQAFKNMYDFIDDLDVIEEYKVALCTCFMNAPENLKWLYNKYASRLCCLSASSVKAKFIPWLNGFVLNQKVDLYNERGSCNVFFHESAHQLAYEMIKDNFLPQNYGMILREAIIHDYENTMQNFQQNGIGYEQAQLLLSIELELKDSIANTISDVFGGITKNQVCGTYIHDYNSYWSRDESLVGVECFANMTADIICGTHEHIDCIQLYLPNAMLQYNKFVKGKLYEEFINNERFDSMDA